MVYKILSLITVMTMTISCASKKEISDIKNTHWILESYEDHILSSKDSIRIPEFIFKENLEFSGNDGCNGIGGKYTFNSNNLILSEVIGTMMYCDHGFDKKYNTAINSATSTKIEGDYLIFYKEDIVILKFKRK
jgi:heat shock protein HslJ